MFELHIPERMQDDPDALLARLYEREEDAGDSTWEPLYGYSRQTSAPPQRSKH